MRSKKILILTDGCLKLAEAIVRSLTEQKVGIVIATPNGEKLPEVIPNVAYLPTDEVSLENFILGNEVDLTILDGYNPYSSVISLLQDENVINVHPSLTHDVNYSSMVQSGYAGCTVHYANYNLLRDYIVAQIGFHIPEEIKQEGAEALMNAITEIGKELVPPIIIGKLFDASINYIAIYRNLENYFDSIGCEFVNVFNNLDERKVA